MKRILVTGGSGLVGNGIRYANIQNNTDIFMYSDSNTCDLRNYEQTFQLFNNFKPTHVIHLAAKVGGLFANLQYGVQFFEDNMSINMNVLKCCKLFNVTKCICCLSTCIFPDNVQYPINESMIHDGPPHYSNEEYAYAKRMLHILANAYFKQYGCKFICIIPTNIYGPHDNFNLDNGHVIPSLIHKAFIAKQDGTPFVIKGSGSPLRQFIYSLDLGTIIMHLIDHYDSIEPIILSPDEQSEVTIGYVAGLIANEFNIGTTFDTSANDGQFKKTASNRKLRGILPDFKFIPIEIGIKITVKWFIDNFDKCRK